MIGKTTAYAVGDAWDLRFRRRTKYPAWCHASGDGWLWVVWNY